MPYFTRYFLCNLWNWLSKVVVAKRTQVRVSLRLCRNVFLLQLGFIFCETNCHIYDTLKFLLKILIYFPSTRRNVAGVSWNIHCFFSSQLFLLKQLIHQHIQPSSWWWKVEWQINSLTHRNLSVPWSYFGTIY